MFGMTNDPFGAPNTGAGAAPAISRAMKLLDEVAASPGDAGISELARRIGLGKSSVHGLISTLTLEGLLAPSPGGKGYVLGPRLVELGVLAQDRRVSDLSGAAL